MRIQMEIQMKRVERSKLIKRKNLTPVKIDREKAWQRYKKQNRSTTARMKATTIQQYNKVVNECLKTIAHYWVHSTGGVYVKGLGYFSLLRPPVIFDTSDKKEYLNNRFLTKGYSYLLVHMTHLKSTDNLGGFTIRRAHIDIRKGVRTSIIEGRRYTHNSEIIKEFIKRRTFL